MLSVFFSMTLALSFISVGIGISRLLASQHWYIGLICHRSKTTNCHYLIGTVCCVHGNYH